MVKAKIRDKSKLKKGVPRRVIHLGRHHELRVYTVVMEVRKVSLRSVLFDWRLQHFGFGRDGTRDRGSDEGTKRLRI
jgi:hypothetical protein